MVDKKSLSESDICRAGRNHSHPSAAASFCARRHNADRAFRRFARDVRQALRAARAFGHYARGERNAANDCGRGSDRGEYRRRVQRCRSATKRIHPISPKCRTDFRSDSARDIAEIRVKSPIRNDSNRTKTLLSSLKTA